MKKYTKLIVSCAVVLGILAGVIHTQSASAQAPDPNNPAQSGMNGACADLTNNAKYQSRMLTAYKAALKKAVSEDVITDDEMDGILENMVVKTFPGCDTQNVSSNGNGNNPVNPPAGTPVNTATPLPTPDATLATPPVAPNQPGQSPNNPGGNNPANQPNRLPR